MKQIRFVFKGLKKRQRVFRSNISASVCVFYIKSKLCETVMLQTNEAINLGHYTCLCVTVAASFVGEILRTVVTTEVTQSGRCTATMTNRPLNWWPNESYRWYQMLPKDGRIYTFSVYRYLYKSSVLMARGVGRRLDVCVHEMARMFRSWFVLLVQGSSTLLAQGSHFNGRKIRGPHSRFTG
jgi:hypothetical protein